MKNHVFCKIIFAFWGMTWNHPEWHLVKYWRVSVRFRCVLGRISVRVLRKLRYGGISRRPFRRSAGVSGTRFFMKNHDFCKFIFAFGIMA